MGINMDRKYSYSRKRLVIIALIIMLLFAMFIITIFYMLFSISRKNIETMYNTTAIQSARDVRHYFTMPMDAVAFSAGTLNKMLKEGASHEEAGQYLINQTATYSSIIDENNTGVYAYYDGEYLDGSGWTPPEDYDPKSREWYKAAYDAGGEIALVKPFLNLQTNTVMMAVSQLLEDGDSVVSMDIFLDSVQEMTENMEGNNDLEEALVIDASGMVVAGSHSDDIGKNFASSEDSFERGIFDAAFNSDENMVIVKSSEGDKMAFPSAINDNWTVVLIVDKGVAFSSLNKIYFASLIVFVATMVTLALIFRYILLKEIESRKLSHLSETDRMTGIMNRGAGELKVRRMIHADTNGMFCLFDLDDFKSINDNYGHDIGDKVLISVATCLANTFRENDVVYRLGGDEFAVFTENINDSKTGEGVVERFFNGLGDIDIPELGDRKINISGGGSFYPEGKGDTFEALYKRADTAVYESKKHSGNYITFQ